MGQGSKTQPPVVAPRPAKATPPRSSAAQSGSVAQSWSLTQANVNHIATSASPAEAGRLVRDAMTEGFRVPLEWILIEKTFRFPVLAHWSFTCTGAGSFETLMQGLDVGLLGTLPADPSAAPKPDCAPPVKGDAPPPTKPARPDPEVTETGHVGLPHLTRRGENLRAWYRGPLTLHITERDQPDKNGHLTLAHTSDQLRRIVPDGREDLSLAAAFEIGRLLALSQPSVVSALMAWRQEQFGAERARQIAAAAFSKLVLVAPALKGTIEDLGRLVGQQVILAASKAPNKVLAPDRSLADPGRPLKYLTGDLDQIIADGFGFSLTAVRSASTTLGVVAALNKIAVPQGTAARFDPASTSNLKTALGAAVDQLTAGVTSTGSAIPSTGIAPNRATDALDALLAGATQTKDTKR
jgi:hypothetical protein